MNCALIIITGLLIDFLNSNFFQSIATIGAVGLGLMLFYRQQRTSRLQKIYFDDSLLKQVRDIDEGLTKTQQHAYVFATAIDEISNLIARTFVDKEILLQSLTEKINSIKEVGQFGESTKEVINFLIPDERGDHITQWFTKYNADIGAFSAITRGQLSILANELSTSDQKREKTKDEEMFKKMLANIGRHQRLLVRHRIMMYLFCTLTRLYANLKFSDSHELANVYQNKEFSKIIDNLDESFKMLFCFYETNEKYTYFSYAKDEDGKYFKIVVENEDTAKITREKLDEKPKGKLNIVVNDVAIADAIIEDTKNNFIMGLIGMANLRNFERRPNIIAEKQRFGNKEI